MGKQIKIKSSDLKTLINEQARKVVNKYINQKSDRFTENIYESVINKINKRNSIKLRESQNENLWVEVRFVQGGDDDYEEISQMFCGDNDAYCEANAQPVIDYLKQWDMGECEITPNKPRIARFDTSYADENGEYTLLYNSSIGGDFLLYRPANEQEISWYMDNGNYIGFDPKIIKEAIVPKACAYCGNPIKQGDNYCSKCGANIQEMVNKHNAWLQQNPNVNSEPMVWGQQSQQPMQQQQQPMQQPPQQRQQPTSTNNNTMIDNQVQQQMQRNMGLQQKMANKIRQQKMAKFN